MTSFAVENRILFWLAGFSVLLVVSYGCESFESGGEEPGAAGHALQESQRAGLRSYAPVRWDTLYSLGGELQDTLLFNPRLLAARDGWLFAYDYHDSRVKAFDEQGQLHWTFGRHGQGPEEFTNATDIQVAPDGKIWIVDGGAGRFTVLTPEGTLDRIVPFGGRMILRAVPGAGEIIGFPISPEHFWLVLNGEGAVIEQSPLPTPELQDADPLVRQPVVASAPHGQFWAAIFPHGRPLLVYEGRELRCSGQLIEGGEFPPRAGRDAPVWAAGIAAADSTVFVLARGRTQEALQIVDEYSARDCRYLRTLRLPQRVRALTLSHGTFYLYHDEPAPTISALRVEFE